MTIWRKIAILVLFFGGTGLLTAQNMHPVFPLLDASGRSVLSSRQPISTLVTCGGCHDTDYITTHNYHSNLGFGNILQGVSAPTGREWEMGTGIFWRWNPLFYHTLSPVFDEFLDLSRPDWVRQYGARHVGGGPAVYSSPGLFLSDSDHPLDTFYFDRRDGHIKPWDWQASGVVEENCFLCHLPVPDNQARINMLRAGDFKWANTATLLGTGIVNRAGDGFAYNPDAFDRSGNLKSEYVLMQDPADDNCGLCHGLVHGDPEKPLATGGCRADHWFTETTGQIIAAQRISDSGMNLKNKTGLSRSWDVHSERLLDCVDCHHSVTNPLYYQEPADRRPVHLLFSPRRRELEDYLYRPSHQFARGQGSFETLAPAYQATMRRCESCHDYHPAHPWLPYRERHQNSMTCESCHIPRLYSPARRVLDWTFLRPDGTPRRECRGVEGPPEDPSVLIKGFEPALLPRLEHDGRIRFSPYNLVTFCYWTFGRPERPVRLYDLKQALFEGDDYAPEILKLMDTDGDGAVSPEEGVLNTTQKVKTVKKRLEALGLNNLRIRGEIQPFAIHHNVAHGEWVTRDCKTCHNHPSKVTRPFLLANILPAGVDPQLVGDTPLADNGRIYKDNGKLFYRTNAERAGFYILGFHSILWVQIIGAASVIGVVLGVCVHGGVRVLKNRARNNARGPVKKVYMYSMYERFWHWMQAAAIILLIFTGLIIHAPDVFGIISFGAAVRVHNAVAAILLINAFLALFYHLTSGRIKQYIPEPQGFFNQAIRQTIYYVSGIFKNAPHPFEKTPDKHLNPLQKITYLFILNVLLPLQIVTGILIWGAQKWPAFLKSIGDLGVLVPFHSLIAWFFAAFLLLHIYLTTTGHTPTSALKAMVVGWEEVESNVEES